MLKIPLTSRKRVYVPIVVVNLIVKLPPLLAELVELGLQGIALLAGLLGLLACLAALHTVELGCGLGPLGLERPKLPALVLDVDGELQAVLVLVGWPACSHTSCCSESAARSARSASTWRAGRSSIRAVRSRILWSRSSIFRSSSSRAVVSVCAVVMALPLHRANLL